MTGAAACPTAPPPLGEKLDQKPEWGFFLFPLAGERQVRKNVRSQAPLSFRTRNSMRA